MPTKEELFNLYSKNLEINSNLKFGWFICPICWKGFLWENEESLSLEHVIPKSLGGRILTLTCKACNNTQGKSLISKLHFNFLQESKIANKKPINASMTIGGKSINIDYIFDKEHHLITQVHRSNPENIKHIVAALESKAPPPFKLKFIVGYKKEQEQMAILLICHLMLFRYFGYFYLFSPWGVRIRKVIMDSDYESPLLKMSASTAEDFNQGKTGLFICTEPEVFRDLGLLQLRFSSGSFKKTIIKVLPFLPDTNLEESTYLQKTTLEIKSSIVNYSPKFLTDPQFKLPYSVRITDEFQAS